MTATTYNALGLVTQITLGNTLKTTYGYYGTGGTNDTTGGYYGRLWEIKTLPQAGGTAVQDVQHTWDEGGNLSTRLDVLASETETFTYDFLDRLTGVSGPYTESFTYDSVGNMTSKNSVAYTYGQNGAGPHAVTSIGDTTYTYDDNGNMTARGSQTVGWDVENRMVWNDTTSTTTWSDAFDNLDTNNWVFNSYQTIDNGMIKNSGNGSDYNANFYRNISNINGGTTGQGIQVEFKVDNADARAHFALEADGSPYRRFVLIAGLGKIYVQWVDDGTNWYYPVDLINPLQINTWYVGRLKVTPSGASTIEVWEKDNPEQRGSFTFHMTAGTGYHFRHWILTGNAWLDNYQEYSLNTATFVYDGDGNRVKKTEGGETILYVNRYYEKNLTTGVVTTNYYLGDRLIATRENTTLTYVHQDALTGTSVTTNSSGTSTGSIKYFSFGQARSGSVSTPQKFTGQRLDSTGLYYYGARYYDSSIGRFISADTIVSDPANPQSLNRYSYCLNNPLKYVDPSGHDQQITATGTTNDAGQEGYFISDGKGNLLGVAYGLDDLAAKSSALESQSRGVDLPVTKQTVDTNTPQKETAPNPIGKDNKGDNKTVSPEERIERAKNIGAVTFNVIGGCIQIIGGLCLIGQGLSLAIGGIIASGGLAALPSIGVGALAVAWGYNVVLNGMEEVAQYEIKMPKIPFSLPKLMNPWSSY